ncbi:hypothetical protein AB0910_14195 [Streptomyces sp. NPDC047002]
MSEWERACAGCGRRFAAEELAEMDDDTYQCERCLEQLALDHLVPERAPERDDGPTRPLGDPGESGRGAGPGRGTAA